MKLTVYNVFKGHFPGIRSRVGRFTKHADFVMAQEWVSSLKEHSGYTYEHNVTFRLPIRNVKTGTCTVANKKHKLLSTEKIITKRRELGFTTRKSALITTYKVKGRELTLVNLHALNFVTNKTWRKEIEFLIKRVPKNVPAIVAGDFNTWNPARFNFLETLMIKHRFSYANYNHNIVMRLDHVFYRGVTIESCECLVSVHNSDHYPIAVEFDFK
jgi:endonuclease/exonuclease/phosphatase (EEP) superfamily protein YafD